MSCRPKAICLEFLKNAHEIEANLKALFGSVQTFVEILISYMQRLKHPRDDDDDHGNDGDDPAGTKQEDALYQEDPFMLLHRQASQLNSIGIQVKYLFFCYENLLRSGFFDYFVLNSLHDLLFIIAENLLNAQDAFDTLVDFYANKPAQITESSLFSILCVFSVIAKAETSLIGHINLLISSI
ncbi:hypothetical protein MDAP_001663 [Mitosporidium daphniae]|uniref:Uncharacterized protein n=1 Tax=Mitosporidium daphniae TaxID=1485682 RepID=A0A098VQD0_9MICR|nr:uncharacterized protein DI09_48p200 [Mitosporidium daphniae]KGG51014.1 hypothetical protein DI09_48p200 [Mitosporidium daphniae]|eukprot:XP_013237441.1 uncharacterized protein DI09_48p200 [Mitosporidium daphniae]